MAPSPDNGSTAKEDKPVDVRGHAARPPGGLYKNRFIYIWLVANRHHPQKTGPPPKRFIPLMCADMLRGLLEFGADPFSTKKDLFTFGLVANRHHHQTTGPPPKRISSLICADMLHGLLEFGAYPFSKKIDLFTFGWLRKAASPENRSTAK